jgi:hypothetical protein
MSIKQKGTFVGLRFQSPVTIEEAKVILKERTGLIFDEDQILISPSDNRDVVVCLNRWHLTFLMNQLLNGVCTARTVNKLHWVFQTSTEENWLDGVKPLTPAY